MPQVGKYLRSGNASGREGNCPGGGSVRRNKSEGKCPGKIFYTRCWLQTFEHLRQHAGDHGEVHKHARVTRRSTNHATGRGKEEDGGAAAANASQVGGDSVYLNCRETLGSWYFIAGRTSLESTSRFIPSASPFLSRLISSSTCQPISLLSSPLSSSINPSLFHSRLKTYLFNKSFPP